MIGEVLALMTRDGPTTKASTDHAVVIEHRVAVRSEPHIGFEPRCSEPSGQLKGFEGVLRGMGTGTPVGEADGRAQYRGLSSHAQSLPGDLRLGHSAYR